MRILYIDIDCARADHFSCNGYLRKTTPNIDRIAAEGVSFTNCHTANSPCLPSRAALFSGRFGFHNGVVSHYREGERMRPNWVSHIQNRQAPFLVHHLWSNGYRTTAFSTFADRHNAWWFTAGFEEFYTPVHTKGQETAAPIAEPALQWLERNAESDNWFLDVHFWDVHSFYRVPDEWMTRFAHEPMPPFPTAEAIERNKRMYGPRTAYNLYPYTEKPPSKYHPEKLETMDDARLLIDGVDGSLAYVDSWIGKFLDLLKRKGVLEDTAIVVSSDHGDSFGEHGQYCEHGIANVAVHNIPLIIRWPGASARGLNDALIYNVDLCPTLCDLLGIRTPTDWDGKPFAAALRGEEFVGWPYLVYDHGIFTLSRAVRTKDWTLIEMYHPGLYPYDSPFYLHDLRSDRYQQVNLYPERMDKFSELCGHLQEWRLEQLRKGGAPDPLEAMIAGGPFVYYTPEMMDSWLRRQGRDDQAEDLKHRLAGIKDQWWKRDSMFAP